MRRLHLGGVPRLFEGRTLFLRQNVCFDFSLSLSETPMGKKHIQRASLN